MKRIVGGIGVLAGAGALLAGAVGVSAAPPPAPKAQCAFERQAPCLAKHSRPFHMAAVVADIDPDADAISVEVDGFERVGWRLERALEPHVGELRDIGLSARTRYFASDGDQRWRIPRDDMLAALEAVEEAEVYAVVRLAKGSYWSDEEPELSARSLTIEVDEDPTEDLGDE
jgi:hypothetical protein